MGGVFSRKQEEARPTPRATTINPTTQPIQLMQPYLATPAVPAPRPIPPLPLSPPVVAPLEDSPYHRPPVLPERHQVPPTLVPIAEVVSLLSIDDDDDSSKPVYTLSVTADRVSFFVPARDTFVEWSRAKISFPALEEGKIYHIPRDGRMDFAAPSELRCKQYIKRNSFICDSITGYVAVILPALILGSRVRDYEQRCAQVVQMGELVLSVPAQRGNPKKLKLKTIHGDTFEVRVKSMQRNDTDKRCMVTCNNPEDPLPSAVRKGCNLDIVGAETTEPRVTGALMRTYQSANTAEDCWPLLSCIYGAPAHRVLPSVTIAVPSIRQKNGTPVILNHQQAEAVARYNSDGVPAFVIEAPPGSGKTTTAAAMAVSYKGKGVQLFLSTANVPVFNMALALAKLDYGSVKAIHFVSTECEDKMTEDTRSPFSVLSLAKATEHLRETIERIEGEMAHAPNEEEKDKLKNEIKKTYGPILDDCYDVYFATVDMILGRLFKQNAGGRHNVDATKKLLMTKVERVVVDEASQLTESALNALIHCFPAAQIVLIGDSKQLPPYKYEEGDVVSELAARPAIEVMKDKRNLPVVKLRHVYRASKSLIAHYSNVFYEGSLASRKNEAKNPLSCFGARSKGSRCLFWKVNNGRSKQDGTSKFNFGELTALKFIVNKLRCSGFDEKDVMIISYYESQRKRAEEALKGYEVLTVDSAQGREKRIVIVLTTRTSVPTDSGSFFTSPKRCNVAVSRHQDALIVIGHPSIASAPNWAEVLSPKYFKHVNDDRAR